MRRQQLRVIKWGDLTPKQHLHPVLLQPFLLCLPPALLQHQYLFIPASYLSSLFFLAYLWLLPFSSWPLQPELGHYVGLVAEAINLRGPARSLMDFPHHHQFSPSCWCVPLDLGQLHMCPWWPLHSRPWTPASSPQKPFVLGCSQASGGPGIQAGLEVASRR